MSHASEQGVRSATVVGPVCEYGLSTGWEDVHWVVDVGGGTGAMLAEILHARPQVRGTLVDRPRPSSYQRRYSRRRALRIV
ncbi:MAG TPA: methyltransferase [Candidatus Solibacter sp.]|nr:methyltransferase [Candidatus Solibacter sp.]